MKSYQYLHFGTCSWKYDSWRGIIYPAEGKFNYLEEYSKHFDTVEIDQWFWSLFNEKIKLPMKKDVVDYVQSVPENFKFTIKVPNSITLTHHYRKDKKAELIPNKFFLSVDLFDEFLNSISELLPKVGMLMLQFEYLNKQKMSSQIEFLSKLKPFLQKVKVDLPIGIELRNPNYLNEFYFEFLNEMRVYNVFLQGYYMPPIWDIYEKYKDYIKDKVVIRLHGPNREDIEEKSGGNWNKIISAKDDELQHIIEILKDLEKRKIETYINVNNHYEGSAPLTIEKIKSMLIA
jgi:uncharacterized protein YecE (DUF72 family)